MILAPRLGNGLDEDSELAARSIAETMVIWFWPRMLGAADREGGITFSVFNDGHKVELPDPSRDAPFSNYVLALKNLVAHVRRGREVQPPHEVREIRSQRPEARLGWLSVALAPRRNRIEMSVCRAIEDHVFSDQAAQNDGQVPSCHHVALMRAPGQVIKYLPCRSYPDPAMEYSGVYLVDGDPEDVDKAYAEAEPPTHDDWILDRLEEDWHKRYVRIGLREVRTSTDAFVESGRPSVDPGSQDPLGAVSAELGELISAPGSGASRRAEHSGREGRSGGHSGTLKARLQLTGAGTLEDVNGQPVFVLPFRIDGELGEKRLQVRANPKVLVAGGGTEAEAPQGVGVPLVVGWRRPGREVVRKTDLDLAGGDGGDWQVLVGIPGEAMTGVSLSIVRKEG